MTVNDAIKRSLRLLGVIDPGVEPDSFMVADALVALNSWLQLLSAQKNAIYAPTTTSFSTVSGTSLYTIGATGDIAVTRPKNILAAWIRESDGTDCMLRIMEMQNYLDIFDKTSEGEPAAIYHERKYPLGDIYLWPTPGEVYTVYLKLWSAFTVYTTSTESLALPLEYEEMVCANFAVRLAPEYQVPVSQELGYMAEDSMGTVKALNQLPITRLQTNPFKATTKTNILAG